MCKLLRLVKFFDKSEILCIAPISIKNPNLGRFVSPLTKRISDCESAFIRVPCGHCKECVAVKQMYFVQRARMEMIKSYLYFTTLTYDNAHLPKITTSQGVDISYVDIKHLQLLFKRLRNNNSFGRPFRYYAVSERGHEKGRPHVHILWWLPMYPGESYVDGLSLQSILYDAIKGYWCINIGSDTKPLYEPLFTLQKKFYRGKLFTNYDTHFVVPSLTLSGSTSVAFYCCKYLFKYSDKETRLQQALRLNYDPEEYEYIWNLVRSRPFYSRSFGLGGSHNKDDILTYLKHCIDVSDRSLGYPQFFNPDTNQVFPLSPFYRNNGNIFPLSVASEFFRDSPLTEFDKSTTEVDTALSEFNRISNIVDEDMSIQFDFLFD